MSSSIVESVFGLTTGQAKVNAAESLVRASTLDLRSILPAQDEFVPRYTCGRSLEPISLSCNPNVSIGADPGPESPRSRNTARDGALGTSFDLFSASNSI